MSANTRGALMPSPKLAALGSRLKSWFTGSRQLLPIVFAETAPLDLRFLGRMLFRAALVGVAAGLMGALFFAVLEYLQRFVLEDLGGYVPLRAYGEQFAASESHHHFRPWLVVMIPALGGLACGLLGRVVPEIRGGGADATIEAFHRYAGVMRRRVIWAKTLASWLTLGSGGSGGREGPTMQIGAAIGSTVGRVLGVGSRERRVLLLAGVAAGIAAVFRTPLGAALLAVELLYRDGFESDALIPAVLASVTSYSVVILIFGESTLFTHASRFPFIPLHLPLYALLALLLAALSIAFLRVFAATRNRFARLSIPEWLKPALGGLMLGLIAVPMVMFVGQRVEVEGQGLGILGGGYGAVQAAISGAAWIPPGWTAVALLAGLSLVKLVASSITIGSGGSAGDFAPSLAIGGLFGGAFGRAALLLLGDPRIDPGAFALVGMGAFYGGIAHVPLATLVLVCELAGNYDLLVPLMLSLGISFVALRQHSLYQAQVPTQRDSPVHRDALLLDVLRGVRVRELMTQGREFASFSVGEHAREIVRRVGDATWQDVFPVVDEKGGMVGVITADSAHVLATQGTDADWMIAADFMQPPVSVRPDDDLRTATERLVANGLRELPVLDESDRIVGFLDEADVARVYLSSAVRAEKSSEAEDAPIDSVYYGKKE